MTLGNKEVAEDPPKENRERRRKKSAVKTIADYEKLTSVVAASREMEKRVIHVKMTHKVKVMVKVAESAILGFSNLYSRARNHSATQSREGYTPQRP